MIASSTEHTTKTYAFVFDLDFAAGLITCGDLGMKAGGGIPVWLWNHVRMCPEWRSTDAENHASIHVDFYVKFEAEDQRPDPNGIVLTARDISVHGTPQIRTDRCDIAIPDHSMLGEHLATEYHNEIAMYAEDNCHE